MRGGGWIHGQVGFEGDGEGDGEGEGDGVDIRAPKLDVISSLSSVIIHEPSRLETIQYM